MGCRPDVHSTGNKISLALTGNWTPTVQHVAHRLIDLNNTLPILFLFEVSFRYATDSGQVHHTLQVFDIGPA